MKNQAVAAFHRLPENLNCAQTVLDAWQAVTGREVASVAEFKAFGGGRAPEGECGALYAACRCAPETAGEMREAFAARAGSGSCRVLKRELRFPCAECVGLAAELLEASSRP